MTPRIFENVFLGGRKCEFGQCSITEDYGHLHVCTLKTIPEHQGILSYRSNAWPNVSALRKTLLDLLGRIRHTPAPAVSCTFCSFSQERFSSLGDMW